MADSLSKTEVHKRNDTKKRLYTMFHQQVESDIIDMVLSSCNYDGKKIGVANKKCLFPQEKESVAYEHLLGMAGDMLDVNQTGRDKVQTSAGNSTSISANSHNQSYLSQSSTQRQPTNLLEQLSVSSNNRSNFTMTLPPQPSHPSTSSLITQDSSILTAVSSSSLPFSSYIDRSGVAEPRMQSNSLIYNIPTIPVMGSSIERDNVDIRELSSTSPIKLMPSHKEHSRIDTIKRKLEKSSKGHLVIMRGLPGSGKSYLARMLCGTSGDIFSSDDYFMSNGSYEFDHNLLQDAHEWNQRRATIAMSSKKTPIFIDNTNTQAWEMRPYVAKGLNNQYEILILEPETDWAWKPSVLAKKNCHGVPKDAIERMLLRYEKNITSEYMIDLVRGNKKNSKAPSPRRPDASPRRTDASPRQQSKFNRDADNRFKPKLTENPPNHQSTIKDYRESKLEKVTSRNNDTDQPRFSNYFDRLEDPSKSTKAFSSTSHSKTGSSKTVTSKKLPARSFKQNIYGAALDSYNESLSSKSSSKQTDDIDSRVSYGQVQRETFSIPPRITRIDVNDVQTSSASYLNDSSVRTREEPQQSSSVSGRIGDIVNNYKSWSSEQLVSVSNKVLPTKPTEIDLSTIDDIEMVDLTEDNDNVTVIGSPISDEQLEFSLQFLTECFPERKKSYCKKWLKRYNGDIVKTCDYFARLSQVDDEPEIMDIDDGDREDDEEDDEDDEDEDEQQDTTPELYENHSIASKKVPQKDTTGELFYCESEQNVGTMSIAMDRRFGRELMRRFAKEGDVDEFLLARDDYVLEIEDKIGEKLYKSWMGSIKARKRKLETLLNDDEKFALKLQEEENRRDAAAAASFDNLDGKGKSKKKKQTPLQLNTEFTKHSPATLFTQDSPWKANQETSNTHVLDATGTTLTAKQRKVQKEFYKSFPGVLESDLDQVLAASSYNLEAATALVRDSCGLSKNKALEKASENLGPDWQVVASPPRKKLQSTITGTKAASSPNQAGSSSSQATSQRLDGAGNEVTVIHDPRDGSIYQTMDEEDQDYGDFRAEANLYANRRAEYFQLAAKAFQNKQGQVAQHYADKAREFTLKMNEAHARAAELTLYRRNKKYLKEQQIIDLHGLHADEAVRALKNFLDNAYNVGHRRVEIITGRGKHSKNGYSTVRKAILHVLDQRRFKYSIQHGGGSVRVSL